MPKGIPNKRYTPEFKKLPVREFMRRFEINNHGIIERRGRKNKFRPLQLSKSAYHS